jgi:hypothetical protein
MKDREPRKLAVVWPLARDLEVKPALKQPLLWRRGVRKAILLVVSLNEILKDRAGL